MDNPLGTRPSSSNPSRDTRSALGYAVTMNQPSAPKPQCSWCHKPDDDVAFLIASPTDYRRAYICDECVTICVSIIEERRTLPQSTQL